MRKWIKRLLILVLVLSLGSNALYYLAQLPVVQNWLIQKVTASISEKIKADVSIGHIELRFFTFMSLEDFLVKDQAGDTLLYAKSLDMGVTNFQPFKKRIFLSDIHLENPTIHLYRKANQQDFNFQFILDSLSTPVSDDESEPYDIRFENVYFTNLDFRMDDSLTMQSMRIAFTKLGIESDHISILNRQISFDRVELDGTAINYQDFGPWAYFVDADFKDEHYRLLDAAQEMLNTQCWEVTVGQLAITNSTFKYDRINRPRDMRGIDYNHIAVESINLDFRDLRILEDTIYTRINSFTAREQCGFEVLSLNADAHISPVQMEFKNLHLITPNSDVTDYYAMNFTNLYSFSEYETAVVMTGRFDQAKVSMKDVNYFAKALTPLIHNTVKLTGEITGAVDNLKGRDLIIEYGDLSRFEGSMSFKGLPNIDATFMSFNVKRIRTTASEMQTLIPSVKLPANLDKLGMVRFSGKFDGFINDFVAEGELLTQIGSVSSDINFKLDEKGNPSYDGHLSTTKFHLGRWLDNDQMGEMTVSTKVKGEGLTLNTLKATAKGKLHSFVVRGYDYKDIDLDGAIARRKFNGSFTVRDEHLDMDFAGAFNLADSIPTFNFSAVVRKADLLPLNLWKDSISFSSTMELDISGNRLDNLNGQLSITKSTITKGDTSFYLDNLFFEAYESGQSKIMSLRSDIANGWVEGNYNFADLPVAGRYFLEKYFNPGFVDTISGTGKMVQQDMQFDINIYDTRNLTQLFYPRLKNISGGKIQGAFDSGKDNLDVTIDIPSITYDNVKLANISLGAGTQFGMVGLFVSVDSIFYSDSLLTEKFVVDAGIIKDSVEFTITLEDTLAPTNLNLSGSLKTDFKDVFVQFKNSTITVEGTKWVLSENNYLVFDGKTLDIKDMALRNGANELSLNSYIVNGTTHLALTFQDIMLRQFIPKLQVITGLRMDGRLNGSVNVMSLMDNPTLMANILVDSFTIENDLLGDVRIQSTMMNGAEQLQVRALLEGPGNNATITGNIGLTANAPLDFTASIEAFDVSFLEKFAANLVDKVHGSANGLIYLKGSPTKPLLTGSLKLTDAGARMIFLNTEYSFTNQVIQFKDDAIELGKIKLKDQQGNSAILAGQIFHTNLKDWKLNMDLETDNFQFLNTSMSSIDAFYGKVFAKGYVFIMGNLDLVELYVSARTTKGTQFFIPVSSSRDVGQYTFYQFTNTDTTRTDKPKENFKIRTTGVRLNLDIEVTPDAEVNLILSEEQGDVISARGNGNILVGYDELENMTMMGNYEVVSGEYTFSMQNIISKRFDITPGSQILWTGDPYDARLAVKAVYKLRAAPYDLIGDVLRADAPIQQSRSRIPTFLYLNLNGSLLSPDISFDIAVPDADAAIRNALDAKLTMIRLDQQELNKQVVGLLVLNRFLPSAPLGSSPNSNVVEGVNNTVSEFISNQLSLYLTDWISKFVTEVELDINFRNYQNEIAGTGTGAEEVDFQNRRELQLALTKSFFNNRVEVDLGGNFDFGDAQGNTNTQPDPTDPDLGTNNNRLANNVAGDFEIRYNITPDGRIKLKVFRKGQYDVFQERNRNRTGVGIAYRREFDSVKEIIQGFKTKRVDRRTKRDEADKKKKQLEEAAPIPAQDTVPTNPMPMPLDLTIGR